MCLQGKEERADYQMLAKAMAREGNCFFAEKDYQAALDCYDESLLEDVSTQGICRKQPLELQMHF